MAYRLKKSESVPEGLKRIILEEIDSASEGLAKTKNRDEAIHEARKSLKKIRGVVRLVQPELGRIYRRENKLIGGLGRRLSELRDATAIIEIFDRLKEKYKGNLRSYALASIRRELERSKQQTEQAVNVEKTIQRSLSTLRSLQKRVSDWPLKTDGFDALAPGLQERYRRGRKAMNSARKQPTPESYHEWRKRVKDHWYHVRLLQSAWSEVLEAREASLKDLETWLGDDHNLTVLCEKIQQDPSSFGEVADTDLFLALSRQYQNELRQNALSLGERVYGEKSGRFTRSLGQLWDAWHNQPDTLKTAETEMKGQTAKRGHTKAGGRAAA